VAVRQMLVVQTESAQETASVTATMAGVGVNVMLTCAIQTRVRTCLMLNAILTQAPDKLSASAKMVTQEITAMWHHCARVTLIVGFGHQYLTLKQIPIMAVVRPHVERTSMAAFALPRLVSASAGEALPVIPAPQRSWIIVLAKLLQAGALVLSTAIVKAKTRKTKSSKATRITVFKTDVFVRIHSVVLCARKRLEQTQSVSHRPKLSRIASPHPCLPLIRPLIPPPWLVIKSLLRKEMSLIALYLLVEI